MIRKLTLVLCISILALPALHCADSAGRTHWIAGALERAVTGAQEASQNAANNYRETVRDLKRIDGRITTMRQNITDAQARNDSRRVAELNAELNELETQRALLQGVVDVQKQATQMFMRTAQDGAKMAMGAFKNAIEKSIPNETEIRLAALAAPHAHKSVAARMEGINKTAKTVLAGGTAAALIGTLGYFAIKNAFNKRPAIIESGDTSMRSFMDKLRGIKPPVSNMSQLVLSPRMQEKVTTKFVGIARAVSMQLPLSNMLFHGPAGTGKTMAAQAFAREMAEKGLAHHVIIRGSAFKRLGSSQAAQRALADVLRWGTKGKGKRPIIFIFDEAEAMFVDRESPKATEITRDLTTTMLSFFERAVDKHKMVIFSTNLPQELDRAMLNRVDKANWVHFEKPGKSEIEKLLDVYYDLHLVDNEFAVPEEVRSLNPHTAAQLHAQGAVGREVDSFAAQLVYRMLNAETRNLTPEIVEQGMAARSEQHNLTSY